MGAKVSWGVDAAGVGRGEEWEGEGGGGRATVEKGTEMGFGSGTEGAAVEGDGG